MGGDHFRVQDPHDLIRNNLGPNSVEERLQKKTKRGKYENASVNLL